MVRLIRSGTDQSMKKEKGMALRSPFLFFILPAVMLLGAAETFAGTLFWKATSTTGTVYLLGSVHMATPEPYPLPEPIEQAFAGADFLAVEANVLAAAGEPAALMRTIQEQGYNPDGTTLRDVLPRAVYAAFTDACAEYGIDPVSFEPMKPWLAAVNFEQTVLMRSGYDPGSGIDMHFLTAASGHKDILELESVDFQFGLFADLDRDLQAELLRQTLAESRQIKEDTARLLEYWRQGDGEKLAAYATASFDRTDPGSALLYRRLITDRNRTIAAKIEGYLRTPQTYFVVVGAGHLLGPDGIVELLRKKGFRLTTPL
jgi:uncharacterized protein YbaP (TraB family)